MKILIVDDEESVAKLIGRFLTGRGFEVIRALEASSALLLAQEAAPNLILSDVNMAGLDGQGLCRVLKKDARTRLIPVILMSGVCLSDRDQISGLEGGADDYVPKPVSMSLLLARIEAVLRRQAPVPGQESCRLESDGLWADLSSRTAAVDGVPLRLTGKEFDLLAVFLRYPDRVHAPGALLTAVWGYDPAVYNDSHTVAVHVSSLRKKLGRHGRRLCTVIGHGYKFASSALNSLP